MPFSILTNRQIKLVYLYGIFPLMTLFQQVYVSCHFQNISITRYISLIERIIG